MTLFCGALAGLSLTLPVRAQGGGDLAGPLVPGVCLLSQPLVLSSALVGKTAFARFQQIEQEADAELQTMRKPIDADVEAFQAVSGRMNATERASKEAEFSNRLQPVRMRAAHLRRELDATHSRILQRLNAEMMASIPAIYGAKGCGLLIERSAVLGGNFANDLTADVIKALDTRLTAINVDRESLPTTTDGSAPAGN